MPQLKLVSFNLCPYVQRSVITLQEKGVPYDIEYIDLANKPDWFLKISPFGKVPLLQVGEAVLFESAVINEYIDEATEGQLHPHDALERARHRGWIEFSSALLMDSYRMSMASSEAETREHAAAVRGKLKRLQEEVRGPLFQGDAFCLVDAAVAPLMQRLSWCDTIEPSLQIFAELPKIALWSEALLQRPSVKASTVADVREIYLQYLKGRGSPARNVAPSWLGSRASA